MFNTPVLFLIFNRPGSTQKVFDIIRQVKPRQLFVAADGPRLNVPAEYEKCNEVRQIIIDGVDWECDLKLLFRDKNIGCGAAVQGAIAWFFENVEEGIILEDDTLPDISFFAYCRQMLELYRNDGRIWSISGFNFGAENFFVDETYTFARMMNMWGWATWRRTHEKVDYNLSRWKAAVNKKLFTSLIVQDNLFDTDINWFDYWTNIFTQTSNSTMNTWDYQWIYSQLLNRQLTIYPSKNLVQNIGFAEDATHTKNADSAISKILRSSITGQLHKKNVSTNYLFQNKFIKTVWCNINPVRNGFIKNSMFKLRQIKYLLKYRKELY